MTDAESWNRWFHVPHPAPELARWARALRVFRFVRARGGHSGDDDNRFLAALAVTSEADLLAVLGALGIVPEYVPPDAPEPEPGRSYTGYEWAAFPSRVHAYPTLRQPGHVRLAGEAAFVWASAERVEITVHDAVDLWDVSEAAFESARRIEPLLAPLAGRIVDPPQDDRYCLCPAYYPEVFAACS